MDSRRLLFYWNHSLLLVSVVNLEQAHPTCAQMSKVTTKLPRGLSA